MHQIIMSLNNGYYYNTPITLSKALEIIAYLPTSIEFQDNFVEFKNHQRKKIKFHRIFNNTWYLEFPLFSKEICLHSLRYKYLSSEITKVIVINFFNSFFLCDLLVGVIGKRNQYRKLSKIFKHIESKIKQFSNCYYCNNKAKNLGQSKCEYCGVRIDYTPFLFPNLF